MRYVISFTINTSILLGCNNHYTSHSWIDTSDDDAEEYIWEYDGYVTYEHDGRMLFYDADGNQFDTDEWGGTFDNTYKQLKFDQLTGWSEWIEVNEQEASEYSPAGLDANIIDGGFDLGIEEDE